MHQVESLEPGSVPRHVLLAWAPLLEAARAAWGAMAKAPLSQPAPPLVLAALAVPDDGFGQPSIPTLASVGPTAVENPGLMLVEGSASDQEAMDRYRDIILPMLFEARAYYTIFELGGTIDVLSGEWDEAILAISRWPNRKTARDFWLCEQCQQSAIPIRLAISRFEVLLFEGRDDG